MGRIRWSPRQCEQQIATLPAPVPRSPRPLAKLREQWRETHVVQRRIQKAIGRHSFFEWLILETLQELLDENGDAVSQAEIARRSGLTEVRTSYWIVSMNEYGLVSRAPSFDGRAYRIFMGDRGEEVLRICAERLAAAGLRD